MQFAYHQGQQYDCLLWCLANAEHVSVDHITLEMLQEDSYLIPHHNCDAFTHCVVFDHYLAHFQSPIYFRACRDVLMLFPFLIAEWNKVAAVSDNDGVNQGALCYTVPFTAAWRKPSVTDEITASCSIQKKEVEKGGNVLSKRQTERASLHGWFPLLSLV